MIIFSLFLDPKILCLGMIQSLFEGSMYIFVLEWTPALSHHDDTTVSATVRRLLATSSEHIPHGHIFAGFMVSKSSL